MVEEPLTAMAPSNLLADILKTEMHLHQDI
jgi:hypothetical protein